MTAEQEKKLRQLADIKNLVMCMTQEEAKALLDECKKLSFNSSHKKDLGA